jgi:phosphatidylethanolamine-binding protein (PEBP) family uncharacterized protein
MRKLISTGAAVILLAAIAAFAAETARMKIALDRELDLRGGAKRSQLDAAMKRHVIAQGELMGRYTRK